MGQVFIIQHPDAVVPDSRDPAATSVQSRSTAYLTQYFAQGQVLEAGLGESSTTSPSDAFFRLHDPAASSDAHRPLSGAAPGSRYAKREK
jgi:hypothetical protein